MAVKTPEIKGAENMKKIIIAIIVMTLLTGIPASIVVSAIKTNEPVWGQSSTLSGSVCYGFAFNEGDNLTINITAVSGPSSYGIYLREGSFHGDTYNNCSFSFTGGFLYKETSNETVANQGQFWTIGSFWIVSGAEQTMWIMVWASTGLSTITYSINITNATPPQDPAIKELQTQVTTLTTSVTALQNQTQNLTNQINVLNITLKDMNQTQQEVIENITNLWTYYNQLNESIVRLA